MTLVKQRLNLKTKDLGQRIMADQGFIMKDMLEKLGIGLNIPPFMEGRQQLPAEEIEAGRKIASLRIHVERTIGRIKTYRILTSTTPLSMQGRQKRYGWCGICHTALFVLMHHHTTFSLCNTCTCMVYACVQPHPH